MASINMGESVADAHDKNTKRFDQLTPAQRRAALGAMATNLRKAKAAHRRLTAQERKRRKFRG